MKPTYIFKKETLHLFTYAPLEEDALWLKKHFAEMGIHIDVTLMLLQELLQSDKILGAAVDHTKTFGFAVRQAVLIFLRTEEGLHSFHEGFRSKIQIFIISIKHL